MPDPAAPAPRSGDPLDALLALSEVAEAVDSARAAVDALLWDRAVAARQAEVAAESALRGYAAGSPDGVADLVRLVAGAVQAGAREPSGWVST